MDAMTDETLLKRAFDDIAERGWCGLSLPDLAGEETGSLADVYERIGTRAQLLCLLGRHLDGVMLDISRADIGDAGPKEIVFELLMRRFDAMRPFKPGLERLARDSRMDPGLIVASMCNLKRMAHWIVGIADPDLRGMRRALGEKAIVALYIRCFSVWLKDDTEDGARTMAELDKRLSQLERVASMGSFRRRSGPAEEAA
jgi:hypothetical protein